MASTVRLGAKPLLRGLLTSPDTSAELPAQDTRCDNRGAHRAVSLVDALVAAVAESRDLTVLHYDGDFETIARITGQPHRWAVERGTVD